MRVRRITPPEHQKRCSATDENESLTPATRECNYHAVFIDKVSMGEGSFELVARRYLSADGFLRGSKLDLFTTTESQPTDFGK